jgi:hypothetical protein
MEPTYVYRKGEGWVAILSGPYSVLFREQPHHPWRNADYKGFYYENLQEALQRQDDALEVCSKLGRKWDYLVVPWTEDL